MTTNSEFTERKEEYILRGNAPDASPRVYDSFAEAEAALESAGREWPNDYHHRLVLRITRVEEIELKKL